MFLPFGRARSSAGGQGLGSNVTAARIGNHCSGLELLQTAPECLRMKRRVPQVAGGHQTGEALLCLLHTNNLADFIPQVNRNAGRLKFTYCEMGLPPRVRRRPGSQGGSPADRSWKDGKITPSYSYPESRAAAKLSPSGKLPTLAHLKFSLRATAYTPPPDCSQ